MLVHYLQIKSRKRFAHNMLHISVTYTSSSHQRLGQNGSNTDMNMAHFVTYMLLHEIETSRTNTEKVLIGQRRI